MNPNQSTEKCPSIVSRPGGGTEGFGLRSVVGEGGRNRSALTSGCNPPNIAVPARVLSASQNSSERALRGVSVYAVDAPKDRVGEISGNIHCGA